ncbi:enoyl-CoA hydratase/isomerase family protein [Desulfoscipio gibsoniae]|uniref:short-chain-enoyl-CoA hydratase n=1 Tax=Desulfoscipio gibsoniae DSM 7213 TaxID=767817 RepID=R4KBY5_9FIRM|nr:enoyl-CoA hydratase-related protein [Desulfoscipio gibsoniae]AGL00069.1 enoyl-CoA hydratase/carnithine racemase [Desulfoscipio gibsoniae DSM 7213]
MSFETILLGIEDGIATITLNRPPVNPLNSKLFRELSQAVGDLDADSSVRAVIITGSGEKAFAAGADISEMKNLTSVEMYRFCQVSLHTSNQIENMKKPTIAAINGLALGGGCELALTCDLRLASDKAKFGLPEITLGIIPGGGGTQRLPRLIGVSRAKELLFLGEMIDAVRAEQIGLVNRVVPYAELMQEAKKLARKLAAWSGHALGVLKGSVNKGINMNLHDALDFEMKNFILAFSSEDRREGFDAFMEKRKPKFNDR